MIDAFSSEWVKRRGYLMRVELPSAQFYRGEQLIGIVRLRSTSTQGVVARPTALSIWTTGGDSTSELVLDERLFGRKVLAPLQDVEHPFWITIPQSASLGTSRAMLTTGGGFFQYVRPASVMVVIAPERWMAKVVELVAEIAHHEVSGWFGAGGGDGFHAQLKPKLEIEDRMLGIGMEVYPSGKGIYGMLVVMPRDRGLFGAIQSFTHPHRFRLPDTDLDAARREFEPVLLPFVNDLNGLPIPSGHQVSLEGLPMPAHEEASQ